MNYKEQQYQRQIELIESSQLFDNTQGGAYFMGKPRTFVLKSAINNLHPSIREKALKYFEENKIDWWRGNGPSGHTLSS